MSIQLSDLKRLTEEPSGAARIEVAEKVSIGFAEGGFNMNERRVAIEIFRLLMSDAEIQVRQLLSRNLATVMDVPHDIIFKLATDVRDVALPMLEKSYVLTEDDLIAITQSSQDVTVMSAIARRDTVSRELSIALLEKANATVIATLLNNPSATIDENGLNHIYVNATDDVSILELMVKRGGLPVTLAEKLFVAVSDEMKKLLTQNYRLSMQVADDSTKDAREFAMLGLIGEEMRSMDVVKLIDHLYQQGRLSLSIIIRSLCLGNMQFFEHAMAKLADVPLTNAQILILDQSEHGFINLYKTSCLPMELFSATQYLLKIAHEETSFGRYQRNDFRQRLAHRLMHDDEARKIEYMDYLVTLIQNNARDAAPAY